MTEKSPFEGGVWSFNNNGGANPIATQGSLGTASKWVPGAAQMQGPGSAPQQPQVQQEEQGNSIFSFMNDPEVWQTAASAVGNALLQDMFNRPALRAPDAVVTGNASPVQIQNPYGVIPLARGGR